MADLGSDSPKSFRNLSDKFVDQNKKDVLLLVSEQDGKTNYLCRTHKSNDHIDCSAALKTAQAQFGGRGGGRKDMAQGSGDIKKNAFLEIIENAIRQL